MEKLILIVEDDPKIRKLTRDMLQVSGYITIEAPDGKQGVELARARKPDLTLMDVMMPKMDGYTACDAIKADKATSEIPVVMLTATDLELNKERAVKLGADGYMHKPFTRQELLDLISQFFPTS